jgi:seryl-tRNA synthetase
LYQARGRTEEALTEIAQQLSKKKFNLDVSALLALEAERKSVQAQVDQVQQERNSKSKSIGQLKSKGQDVSQIMSEVEGLKAKLQAGEHQMKSIEERFEELLLAVPNAPHESVPVGTDEADNEEVRKWGTPRAFDFPVKDHVDVAAHLHGMDFALASKITGTRFVLLQGQVALMHRALVQYMLDTHTQKHGYTEVYVPYIVNADSLRGTGQLPKFKEDLFAVSSTQDKELFLIPTAEVRTERAHPPRHRRGSFAAARRGASAEAR